MIRIEIESPVDMNVGTYESGSGAEIFSLNPGGGRTTCRCGPCACDGGSCAEIT